MQHLKENLLVQFSVISFVVMAVLATVLVSTLSGKVRSVAVEALVDEAVGASEGRLWRQLTPADLETPMTGARHEKFDAFVQEQIVSDRTARIKIWSSDGTVIYAAEADKVGQRYPENEGYLASMRGDVYTELKIPDNAEHSDERDREALMEVYAPFTFPGSTEVQGAVEFYQYYAPTATLINDMRRSIVGWIGAGFVLLYASLVVVVWRGWRTILRQREVVTERTAQLHDAHETLVRAERLAAIGELSAGIAHEIRNPLGAMKNAAYYIRRKIQGSELAAERPRVVEFLGILDDEIETCNTIITDLMDYARVRAPDLAPYRIGMVVDEALARNHIKDSVAVTKSIDPDLPEVHMDAEMMRRVFGNLITNADEAMPHGGDLTISARAVNSSVEMQFADTGEGIRETDLLKLFEPLYTTKPKGTGMGLAIVKSIIERHGGAIRATANGGGGATFTVRLPLRGPDGGQPAARGQVS